MSGAVTVFVVVPCIFACLAALVLSDWRLAAAFAAGSVGMLFVVGPILLPGASGIATASLALVPLLVLRPAADVWSRLTVALLATFAIHYALILTQA